jgi:hypothetical protein
MKKNRGKVFFIFFSHNPLLASEGSPKGLLPDSAGLHYTAPANSPFLKAPIRISSCPLKIFPFLKNRLKF